ncbi:MAG: restriction endonuclease [Clostridiales bacterium]|nr:restriction endonuclease [Clostridiales bacterium]
MECQFCGYITDEVFCPICGEYTGVREQEKELSDIRKMMSRMNGEEFEAFCARLLERNGFSDVRRTKRSGDHGVDITAEKDDITYAIQCKRYKGSVGNKAVQEANTGRALYHKDIAVVMTSSRFTDQAREEARALGVKLWDQNTIISKFL